MAPLTLKAPANVPGSDPFRPLSLPKTPVMLPNITGTSMLRRGDSFGFGEFDTTGAFYQTSFSSGTTYTGTQANNRKSEFGIDASRTSAVYCDSDVVQPAALHALACIKS